MNEAGPINRRASRGSAVLMPQVAGVSHRFIQAGRLRVHVAEAGAGPPVILLHGQFQHWYAWRGVVPALAAAGFRLICPDMRGHGWTETPGSGYGTADLAADEAGRSGRSAADDGGCQGGSVVRGPRRA